jgi:hypothetical protein
MVGMKMREKETVYLPGANSGLRQANYNTAATVKQEPVAGHFDKNS